MKRLWVIDTNVVVAALLTNEARSPTALTLDAMLGGGFLYLLSPDLLAEYRSVLMRPKLRAHHGLTEGELDDLLATLTANAVWREPGASDAAHQPPDDGDAHLWHLLACEPSAALVTGDQLLLKKPYPGREFLTPRELWESQAHADPS